jgi:hypothetical protein
LVELLSNVNNLNIVSILLNSTEHSTSSSVPWIMQ